MTVEVDGLRRLITAYQKLGTEVSDLKAAMTRIGQLVADEAKRRAPKKSGALANSIRPGKAKNKASIRAGGARIPYAHVQEFGWPRRNIVGQRFMTGAVADKQEEVVSTLRQEIDRIAARLNLT